VTAAMPDIGVFRTGHVDTFCEDHLPPADLRPMRDWSGIPELAYPARLNCATELLDGMVEAGGGERLVFRFPGGSWTYRHLMETANRIAHVLVEDLGVVPGNRVLLRGPNNPMLAACWFGVLKAGGVVVCTMPLLREREIRYLADKAEITLALTDSRIAADCQSGFRTRRDGSRREAARVVELGTEVSAEPASGRTSPDNSFESLIRDKPASFTNCDTDAEDIAIIAFTSGTTGEGKGTMHSHRDIMAITDCFPRYVLKPSGDDIFCGSPPLAFTYALGGLLLFPMRFGACSLLLEQATPPNLIDAIQEYRPTICFTAPTAYRAMCGMLDKHDVSSLKKCVSAGETLPLTVFESWERATGMRIIDGIGATEMLHIFISSAGDDIRPGATGKVVPGYQAKILDDDDNDAPVGTIGRLAVRGPTGCRYLDDLEQQRKYVHDGWNLTGDSYLLDADGYFWYQARSDDMIISGGYNIAGPEVENVLLEHESVLECAVIGEPDEQRGHVVKAVIVLREGHMPSDVLAKELQDFVKARIAPYKYPRRIEFAARLPRTSTGKLQRYRLREIVQ
jgi:2-aminobenzoate-CoA ligase